MISIRTRFAALGIAAALGIPLAAASSASAAVSPTPVVTVCPGTTCQAGYQNPNSGARFRRVTANLYLRPFTATAPFGHIDLGEHLLTFNGGAEASLALRFNGLTYVAFYNTGGFTIQQMSGVTPMHVGDVVRLTTFYNRTTGEVLYTVHNYTTGLQSNRSPAFGTGLNFRQSGVGVEDDTPTTGPPVNKVVRFTHAGVTKYNGVFGHITGSWVTQQVIGVDAPNVVLSPLSSLNSATGVFSVFAGTP
jgi:hypothetical protein